MARTCVWARACQLYACRLRFEASVRKGEFDSISFGSSSRRDFHLRSSFQIYSFATWRRLGTRNAFEWHWQLRTEIITTYRNCSHRTRRAARSCRFTEIFFFPPRSCNRTYRARYLVYVSRYRTPTFITRVSIFVEMFTEKETFFSLCFFFSHFRKNWWRAPRLTERSVFAR